MSKEIGPMFHGTAASLTPSTMPNSMQVLGSKPRTCTLLGPLFHGTDSASADSIRNSGQRSNFRGIQIYGPGFYVTPHEDTAQEYAEQSARSRGKKPAVQEGYVDSSNPVEISHGDLIELGRKFRAENPHVGKQFRDVDLGNIALRQKGHDFMRVTKNVRGQGLNVGVVLRPNRWKPEW